ncbi:cyclin-L2 isoform X1 [Sapajus apella]|uniref:Cyclin-L2 isoform X1 n=2 Tax=Sapajus apella TaxID=9515 RepID=A0A6J3GKP0_SAPAP|nr:cyclin-L2 isoform X1 [Sapajus apella]
MKPAREEGGLCRGLCVHASCLAANADSRCIRKSPSHGAVCQTCGPEPLLGSSMRLLFAAWTPTRSEFWAFKVLANNYLTRIFQIIVMYLQVLECERNQHLVQTSWNYMNDSLRTDVFVRFQPESIACACIYLAARTLEIPLPNRPHWFLLFGATEEEIKEICLKILQLYARKKVDLTHLEGEVEKRKHAIEEAKAQARGLLPGGAQVPDGTAGFSPAPKLAESPTEGKGSKPSPLSVKNSKKRAEGTRKAKAGSPVNGLPKGRESRSRSRSCEQSYSRSPSRSASPKRRKSDSGSTSGGSKSQSRSRSRSDSPPRQAPRSAPYKSSEIRGSRKSKDCKYPPQKPHKSRSRSSSCSRSRSRERVGNPGKYKKKSHYYRDQRRERSRSYERTGRRYERDHPGHSRHRR